MAGRTRLQVGSTPWIAEERSSAMNIAESEVEEFTFSVRNDFDWLNEHMAEVFGENQINVAEIFKTPGKLRGKTPRTARKLNGENRVPLSSIFSSAPKLGPNPFSLSQLGRQNSPRVKIATDPVPSPPKPVAPASPLKQVASSKPAAPVNPVLVDSGYHGSQSQDAMQIDDDGAEDEPTRPFSQPLSEGPSSPADAQTGRVAFDVSDIHEDPHSSPMRPSPKPDSEPALVDSDIQYFPARVGAGAASPKKPVHHESTTPAGSPTYPSPKREPTPAPALESEGAHTPPADPPTMAADGTDEIALEATSHSPSEGSSPIPVRPVVRKSSLNFASLPAREPITHKSIGNRVSRTSHLDQNRTSYYRHTGGKSLGNVKQELTDDENDDMDIDELPEPPKPLPQVEVNDAATHSKTYTQRLQDQISKLGKAQANVQQAVVTKTEPMTSQNSMPPPPTPAKQGVSPVKAATTPGAFPEDDDDDWIQPLGTPDDASNFKSPRPPLPKSHSADVMEGLSGADTVGASAFELPKTRPPAKSFDSPKPSNPQQGAVGTFGHHTSASVPVLPVLPVVGQDENALKEISVSNPTLAPVAEDGRPATPKSPSRAFNNSPLKQVKNKLSSILKSSRGLLASSAAISAEGKSSLLSPSVTRLGLHAAPSTDTLRSSPVKDTQPLYPDLSRQVTETQTIASTSTQDRPEGRRTRASIEREKAEEKRKKEEAKEAKRMAEQMEKLEKAREKEREKARDFSKEQERIVAMEKQAAQKEQDKRAAIATPSNNPKATRTSPRRTKPQAGSEDQDADPAPAPLGENSGDDVEMVDAQAMPPPPSVRRPVAPPSAMKAREIKRPIRPTKETTAKAKQAPTVIRVAMGSQHPQFHPSNSTLSSSLHDTLAQSQVKASQPALQGKQSLQSLKSSTSSSGRPKALEAAARRKEQEEREAQRKREAKAELERKRAALQEEEKRQEQRKLEAERQKEEERKQAEAKRNAQRQAMLEKAKQTRAPPPAIRTQPGGPPDYSRTDAGPARPPSRMGSIAPDGSRPVNAILAQSSKGQTKRPLPQEPVEDGPRANQVRNANTFQTKESKRMRMTDELNDTTEKEKQPSLKGAPVRPSAGIKKELPAKSMFASGYANVPQGVTRDLFKSTVTSQHNSQIKSAHPLDMAQVSKSAIPFATNTHPTAGPSKTPARPAGMAGMTSVKSAAKSATRSSPRFQNGESIELPEINTDDESDEYDDDDGAKGLVADWADSPNLRRALVEQEHKNPFEVFGPPAPLNMEEVFARNKDRFPKFRARTSSANWSGPDGLSEEDIRKDLAAREKMRREGGWTYDMGREMV
ncbi:hypothetical protein F5Y17DRAFT_468495 [Xylariaceae sp. FL0594]|nr:hypothetical protein F5Y17DRAFT_468495 [Xylariaceae sp. FL0594]